jgi:Xaa-Pro aminopeptidase
MNHFAAIQCKLQEYGLDAMLVTSPSNRKYATDFPSSAGMALVTKDEVFFYIDSRYIEAAKKNIHGANVDMVDIQRAYDAKLNEQIDRLGIKTLGIEEGAMSLGEYRSWEKKLHGELKPAQKLLLDLRTVKDQEELDLLIRAQRIAEKALVQVLELIKPGMTERQVAAELIYRMLREGADGVSFEPIVVTGVKSSMPHGVPGDEVIKTGDFLTMDFGCRLGGYCSDMTRTVAIGSVTEEMRKVYDTVLLAQTTAIKGAKAGMTGVEVDGIARKVIQDAGYGDCFGHGFGHGVGLDVHEAPTAGPSGKEVMPANAVISAEPGIYLEGRFGVRIEDVIILKEGGCEDITLAPKELLIL